MKQHHDIVPGLATLIFMTLFIGCASHYDNDLYRTWLEGDPEQWQLQKGATTHHRDTLRTNITYLGNSSHSDASDLGSEASVESYIRLALERNPSIRAAEMKIERLGARVPQVTSLDDPMFQIAPFGDMAETAAGQVGLMTGVSQKLPLPVKLKTRGRIAEQDVAMALHDLHQMRLRIVSDTRQAYWSYYFTSQALKSINRSKALLSQFKQIAEAEYKAGNRSQADVLRAATELSNVEGELITLKQRQDNARRMLNQLMDRPLQAALPEPTVAELEAVNAELDDLLARAAQHNPAIARMREKIEQYRQKQKLARLNRWPDLNVSVNYVAVEDDGLSMAANGDDQWWFGLGFNLPIWAEKYQAAEREAVKGMLESVAELTAEQNRIAFQVEEAYSKVIAQQKLLNLFQSTIVPQARQTLESTKSSYRAGKVDFLSLIDNWRKLLNFELMQHRAQAEMEQAVAELEQVVGSQIERGRNQSDEKTHDMRTQP